MSPIQPPSKRRRLNTATNTLSQPFKSPLKTPCKPKSDPPPPPLPTNETPSSPPTKPDNDPAISHPTSSTPPAPTPATTTTTPLRRTLLPHQHPPSSSSPSSQAYLALQKHHTRLLNHLSTSRAALETSTQALKIESSTRDADLAVLIQKWKSASRAAAEEVFERARDKVNRMGGVGAMRERERERCRGGMGFGWDDADAKKLEREDGAEGFSRDGEEDEGGETGYDDRRRDVEDEVDAREEGASKRADEAWGDDDEAGYTMDMMLRSLNIELGVIGFDPGLQKWID